MTAKTAPETRSARALRSTLRLSVPGGVVAAVLAAGPAFADVPEGWSQPDDVSVWQFLMVLLVLPVGAALLIVLAFYAPILARGGKISSQASPVEDQWLGGPRAGRQELEESGSGAQETGGASGRW